VLPTAAGLFVTADTEYHPIMGTRVMWLWVVTATLIGCDVSRSVATFDAGTGGTPDTRVVRDLRARSWRDARGRDLQLGADVAVPARKVCVMWCSTSADCPLGLFFCVNNRCVMCKSDADCPPPLKGGCDTQLGVCRMCASDAHCWISGTKLMTGKCSGDGVCLRCDTTSDCSFTGSPFNACTSGQCSMCTTDAHCGPSFTRCNVATGHCVCANDAECCTSVGAPAGCGLLCRAGRCECLDDATCINAFGASYRCR
jgi:hypothetical protein